MTSQKTSTLLLFCGCLNSVNFLCSVSLYVVESVTGLVLTGYLVCALPEFALMTL